MFDCVKLDSQDDEVSEDDDDSVTSEVRSVKCQESDCEDRTVDDHVAAASSSSSSASSMIVSDIEPSASSSSFSLGSFGKGEAQLCFTNLTSVFFVPSWSELSLAATQLKFI